MQYSEAKALGLARYHTGLACKNGHIADRRTSTRTCVVCMYECRKRWQHANRERDRELNRQWKRKHNYGYDERSKARMRAYYRKKMGIPVATRPTPSCCECCGDALQPGKGTHLDHCHVTGAFRGWLCNRCNRGLGYFKDSIEGVKRALAYLERACPSTKNPFQPA